MSLHAAFEKVYSGAFDGVKCPSIAHIAADLSRVQRMVEALAVASDKPWRSVPRVRPRLSPPRERFVWCMVAVSVFPNEPEKRAYHLFNRRRRDAKAKQVLYLHGYHMNGKLFASLTKRLRPKSETHKRHIFVDGRYECDDGPQHRGWYKYTLDDEKRKLTDWNSKEPVQNEDAEYLWFWTEHMKQRRSALVGFSQGARFALRFAMRHPERVSHLVLIGMPCCEHELEMMSDAFRHTPRIPIAVVGSPEDEQCEFGMMRRAADRLGATVLVTYEGGHRVILRKEVREPILRILNM